MLKESKCCERNMMYGLDYFCRNKRPPMKCYHAQKNPTVFRMCPLLSHNFKRKCWHILFLRFVIKLICNTVYCAFAVHILLSCLKSVGIKGLEVSNNLDSSNEQSPAKPVPTNTEVCGMHLHCLEKTFWHASFLMLALSL